MALVGIALGTNLGDKIGSLQAAKKALQALNPSAPLLQSSVYRTTPVDCPEGSPDFYNTVLEIKFEGSPEQLIEKTQALETLLGRTSKTVHNEARIIDLDILYYDDVVFQTEKLQIPHPRMTQRRFVLEPLAEICPDRLIPEQRLTVSQLLNDLDSSEPPLERVLSNW